MDDPLVLAHGLSGGRVVPIPFGFAVSGADAAVLLSFLIAVTLQKESVLRGAASGRAAPPRIETVLDSPVTRVARRALGGRLVLRNPFDGLDSLRADPGLVAVVCVWLGSTAFDGFTRSSVWGTSSARCWRPTSSR